MKIYSYDDEEVSFREAKKAAKEIHKRKRFDDEVRTERTVKRKTQRRREEVLPEDLDFPEYY